jgi:hypothetical protein
VNWLNEDGQIEDFVRIAPAMPIFEEAFNAFTHGALISTTEGPVAVEDLLPGMMIETASGTPAVLRWIGAITLIPGAPCAADLPDHLFRVTADAFGLGRPASDVNLGPGARLLNRDPKIRNTMGSEAALAPVRTFSDGFGVIEITPVSPTRVYHLALDTHEVIMVNGIEVESYHPGPDASISLSSEMSQLFTSLFPHLNSLEDFGRSLWPRLSETDADEMDD